MKEETNNLIVPLDDDMLTARNISKLITSKIESSNEERVVDVCEYPEIVSF
jgi:hypothetical protein